MKWSNWIRKQVYSWSVFVLPNLLSKKRTCTLCLERHQGKHFICCQCEQSLPKVGHHCLKCAIPLICTTPLICATPSIKDKYCGQCLSQQPTFDDAYCNFIYAAPIDRWLQQLKSKRKTQWAKKLASLMLLNPPANLDHIDAFTCVPSARKHLIQRGFNPAELIAQELSRKLNKPIIDNLTTRSHNQEQKNLNRRERINNVKHHFHRTQKSLNGEHIMLIDDVMTTGSTAESISRLLKQAGASQVSIWCLARTPKH